MALLLDTHAALWWLGGEPLADDVAERIADPATLVAISAASVWEVAIKRALGKLRAPESFGAVVVEEGFTPLAVTFDHAERVGVLPPHHRDPFDRLLVAQAQAEGLTLVTRHDVFARYDVPVLRC